MDIVEYIAKQLKAKTSIPIKDTNQKRSKNQKKLSITNQEAGSPFLFKKSVYCPGRLTKVNIPPYTKFFYLKVIQIEL